ncbi:autoinducer binding domain-containing protein (plasmid) [Burkholderia sp. FERM BP-3421]|jgi:DNA-binding CsgD family transcriptional regulator|uniref:autoinducer binding domain-containing protein n=1 Tax=Burkholderia sp. FERM BP-3421 TaxID=1494466 RepID=UPI00235E1315|nr:autoinducer binding domain-containing protein [Burkholderia sp. FERM BP-3421]WDD90743.1 autoinducer binding domain-containing protein [Burkholderia sp. FERM BP-3421]
MIQSLVHDDLPSDTVRSLPVPLSRGRVVISLRGRDRAGFLLERRRTFANGTVAIQRMAAAPTDDVEAFISNETQIPAPRQRYAYLLDALTGAAAPPRADGVPAILDCQNEIDLLHRLRIECARSHARQSLFHVFLIDNDDANIRLHDVLITGSASAGWSQRYSNNGWFQTDPVFQQARRHNYQPVGASQLRGLAREHWFHQLGIIPDLGSSVFFLTRHENAVAVLHVATAAPDCAEEAMLLQFRHAFNALAADTLVRYLALRRAESSSKARFEAIEEQLLSLLAHGFKTPEIEQRLNITHSTFRDVCRSINHKLGTHDIRLSVKAARNLGLVRPLYDY